MMPGGKLGSREWEIPAHWVVGGSVGHHATKAVTVILAGALALGAFMVVPRPHITLSDGRFSLSECELSTLRRVVTATFTLRNTGQVAGFADVHLNVDGTSATMNEFGVPADASISGELASPLADCAAHTFSLRICFPHSGRGSYC